MLFALLRTKMKSILGLIGLLFLALSTVDAGRPRLRRDVSPDDCWFEKQNGQEPVKVLKVLKESIGAIEAVTITGANPSYISDNIQYWNVEGDDGTYEVNCKKVDQISTGLCNQIAASENQHFCPICHDTSFTVTIGTTSRYVDIPCVGNIKHAEVCETKSKKKCFTVSIGNEKVKRKGKVRNEKRRRLLQGADGGC